MKLTALIKELDGKKLTENSLVEAIKEMIEKNIIRTEGLTITEMKNITKHNEISNFIPQQSMLEALWKMMNLNDTERAFRIYISVKKFCNPDIEDHKFLIQKRLLGEATTEFGIGYN